MTVARSWKLLLTSILVLGVLLSSSLALAGCGEEKTTTTAATVTQDQSSIIADRALKILASTNADYPANAISASDLNAKLGDPGFYLLDIRSKADYDKGHIQGSTQVEFKDWASKDNLTKYPKDKTIVVICYTGNTAAQTTAGLRLLGHNAIALKGGINAWAPNMDQAKITAELEGANYETVTTPQPNQALPTPADAKFTQPSDSDEDVIAEKANTVFSSGSQIPGSAMTAADLNAKLGDTSLFLLDIRSQADYEKGHINGASRVDFTALGVPENLSLLPKDKQIVVICYTGNTAGQAVTMLRMLGYDAVVLKYGMAGWTPGPGRDGYIKMLNEANYPVVTS